MNVLVIAPHADDETLGCGATIAGHVDRGDHVRVVILTNASIGAPELFSTSAIELVREESRRAMTVLGCDGPTFLDLPAPQLDQYPQFALAHEISQIIAEWQPETVYLPFEGDLHVDHTAIAQATLVATRPQPGQVVRNLYAYETLSETEWGSLIRSRAFAPTHFVAVDGQLERKLAALECYASQIKEFPHSRSLEAVRALATYRGACVGTAAAEAFMVVRQIRD